MKDMSNIFKVNNKDTWMTLVASTFNLQHLSQFIISTVIIAEFEQINAG